jgi:predicted molibdopterin-dependent oxidoreductase YjgC
MVAIIRRRIQILRESAQTADSQTLFSIVADITRLDEEAYQYEVRSVIALREAELANTNTGGERREAVAAELEAYRNLLRN